MAYCGPEVSDSGAVAGSVSAACLALFPAAQAAGIRTELILNSGNCSIAAYRLLWADKSSSVARLLALALQSNASGLNLDLEPQADNCKGGPTGVAADAEAFAGWLAALRAQLQPHGIRLTVDVAQWSPVLSQYGALAEASDRLFSMSTYNAGSAEQWLGILKPFLSATPLAKAGVGLGAWSDGAGAWWETAGAAAFKVNASMAAQVPELAVFRLLPQKQPQWPLPFWWPQLERFAQGSV
jgi:hypothetical protein